MDKTEFDEKKKKVLRIVFKEPPMEVNADYYTDAIGVLSSALCQALAFKSEGSKALEKQFTEDQVQCCQAALAMLRDTLNLLRNYRDGLDA